jgi:hypothetical protein
MVAGKHGHKLRQYRRRLDAVLAKERECREPIPPPISEEHAALRKRIEEAYQTLLDAEDSGDVESVSGIVDSPDARRAAVRMFQLMREEQDLLARHGVDRRHYQS